MKKIIILLICIIMLCCACGSSSDNNSADIDESQLTNIAEMATLKCYYHNVAKFKDKETSGFLFWKKDTHFWMEYGGIVEMGVNAAKIHMKIRGNKAIITMPKAEVISSSVDRKTLSRKSIITEDDTTEPTFKDTTVAVADAEKKMEESAKKNSQLLAAATSQAKAVIRNYVVEVGKMFGKNYKVEWTEAKK